MKVALMNTKRVITGIDIFLGSCNKAMLIVAIARKIQERIKILYQTVTVTDYVRQLM